MVVGEKIEEVPLLRSNLLEAREHAVHAVETVARFEDPDGDEGAARIRERDEGRNGNRKKRADVKTAARLVALESS